ncbi:Mitochondrial fission protein [Geranomyces variabilis]|nr:Mitochondrial fission protein [Geranomyces variabilis]
MVSTMFTGDSWTPAPPPVGEDIAWREVVKEKEWVERAKDMSVPSLSSLRTGSFGGIAPSLLQRKDSTFENKVNPWGKSMVFGQTSSTSTLHNYPSDLFASTAAPAEMFSNLNLSEPQFEESDDGEADEESGNASEQSTHPPYSDYSDHSDNESIRSHSPPKLHRRRSSIVSIKSLPRVFDNENLRPDSPEGFLRQQNSSHSSSSTLIDSQRNGHSHDDINEADILEGTSASEADAEELSPESSITFYQGFRALHPKLSAPVKPNSPHTLGLGLNHANEITLTTSFKALPRPSKQLPDKARLHAASINNIARLFSELLSERDSVLEESDKLENQRNAISDELKQIEDLLTDLSRRKLDLTGKLKRVVAKEEKVNVLLEKLDAKIGSIGDESQSFERTIRTLKGHSASYAADVEIEDERPAVKLNTCFKTLYGHTDSVECLDFDMPFGTLVSGSADKSLRVWDLSSHRCAALLQGHTGWVRTVQIKDQTVMSGSGDHTIRQWNLANLPPLPPVTSKRLASSPQYVPEPEEVCSHVFTGHTGGVGCLMFDEKWLVSGSVDKTIRQWDRETGAQVAVLRSEKWVDSSHMDKADLLLIGDYPEAGVAGSEDDFDGEVVAPGSVALRKPNKRPSGFTLSNAGGHVGALQFWRHALAAGYGDGIVRLWDLRTGKCHRELSGHTGAVTTLKFDHNHVITGSVDKTVKVWDLRAGEAVDHIHFDGCVNDLHHDMFRLTVAGGSKDVQIYNRTTSAIKVLDGHTKPVRSLKHMDDTLISGGMDTTVRLWRI